MDRTYLDSIAKALLYEGYILYPYRRSSLKNSRRWMLGTLYPESWTVAHPESDRSYFQMECLIQGGQDAEISVLVRFLHSGLEREVCFTLAVRDVVCRPQRECFAIAEEPGVIGEITVRAVRAGNDLLQFTLIVRNTTECATADRDLALMQSLTSAHAAISASRARFVSMIDPPPALQEAASRCVNSGVWPVLVGAAGSSDMMLASPIILADYPRVAPESPGDLCDATEIDEILSLRILTLTDNEKAEVLRAGDRGREILERTELLPHDHLMRLHGTMRNGQAEPSSAWDSGANSAPAESIRVRGIDLRIGDRVRLHPSGRADIFDSVLGGRIAVIASIEQDFEGLQHVAVVLEDDPGRDLGQMRQIGHRFFFSPAEIEPIEPESRQTTAGI